MIVKKNFLLLVICIITLLCTGCNKNIGSNADATKNITFKGETYTVPSNPEKIITLSNSLLSMLDAVDGKAIARVETNDPLPDKLAALPTVGHTSTPSVEAIIGMHPDLILGLANQHDKLKDQLTSNHLPYILINYDGINDNIPLITLLGQLTNHTDKANAVIEKYTKQVDAVKEAVKHVTPAKVAILRATGKSVTAETNLAITGSMIEELGMQNVVMNHYTDNGKHSKTIPYSLETLAADNPDIIFVVTMGKEADITATMQKEMTNNPAWNELNAVKQQKVFYLPSKLFLLNPGLDTPSAMATLVQDAYGITIPSEK